MTKGLWFPTDGRDTVSGTPAWSMRGITGCRRKIRPAGVTVVRVFGGKIAGRWAATGEFSRDLGGSDSDDGWGY